MKKIRWMVLALGVLVLAACNNDEVTNAPDAAPTEQEQDNNNDTSTGSTERSVNAPFHFSSFSLDVTYSMTESYEVDYENEQSGVEASIEDLKGNKTTGDEAYTQLEPIFTSFSFDAATANDQVIAEVLKAFDLADTYETFELEIRFADGTEKEYRVNK